MEFSPVILAHLFTAIGALAFGGLTFALRKGTHTHKLFGRIWVSLILASALISFGIQTRGHFSPIHILSVVMLVGVSAAVYAAAKGRIRMHRRGMTAAYISLVIAGAFTLLPGRRLGDLVWHAVGLG